MFLCVALLGTGSRGPLVAAAFAVVVFLAATRPKVSEVGAAFFCFALAAVIGVVAYLPDLIPERFRAFIESPTGAVEASGRAELWEAAPDLIRDNPWGIGWGNWNLEVNTTLHWPHNLFAEVLIEAGWLPGAVVLVVLAATLVRAARRARHDPELSLILLLLAAAVVSVSVSGDINARTFFALLVLCWVATSWPRPEQAQPGEAVAPSRLGDEAVASQ